MKYNKNYVYIFGNSKIGFLGHTFDNSIAKAIKQHRKHLDCHKVIYDNHCEETLSVNNKFFQIYDNTDIYLTADEEESFITSFTQFQSDNVSYIKNFISDIKCIKWNKNEKDIVLKIIDFLNSYVQYMCIGQYEDDGIETNIFNNEEAIKYYIKYNLDELYKD